MTSAALTPQQIEDFARHGFLRLGNLIPAEKARLAGDYVKSRLGESGLWKDGAWRLDAVPRPKYPDSGPSASKTIGNKHPALQALVEDPAVVAVVSTVLQGREVDRKWSGAPQILLTLPNAAEWAIPTRWHVDYPRLASGRSPGVALFTFLDVVEHRGAGTVVVPGTHLQLNEGRFMRSKEVSKRLKQPGQKTVAMTGRPGDVYFTDLRLLHAGAPNASTTPRIMLTYRFVCADVAQELEQGLWPVNES